MSKTGIALIVVTVLLAGTAAWAVITMNELNSTKEILGTVRSDLAATSSTLETTQAKLDDTETELADRIEELADADKEINSLEKDNKELEDDLEETEDELTDTRVQLSYANTSIEMKTNEIASLNSNLEQTEAELSIAQETLDGLGITLSTSRNNYDARMVDNASSNNPTWAELKTFLMEDLTDLNTYVIGVYDCSEFSRDVHNNAEAAGIRSAVVHVNWIGETTGHALNAFLTSDYGLVYVDCTGGPDTVANIQKNKRYRSIETTVVQISRIHDEQYWNSLGSFYYIPTDTGGEARVEHFTFYW